MAWETVARGCVRARVVSSCLAAIALALALALLLVTASAPVCELAAACPVGVTCARPGSIAGISIHIGLVRPN
jgi:hypothetical protein